MKHWLLILKTNYDKIALFIVEFILQGMMAVREQPFPSEETMSSDPLYISTLERILLSPIPAFF